MHARGGLLTEYMSPEWMECVDAAIDEAARLGLRPWIYDENGWPSGFASGLVPQLGDGYRQKYLRFSSWPGAEIGQASNLLGVYDRLTYEPKSGNEIDPERTYAVCFYELNPYYVDLLDGRVTEAFLRFTHERYRERLSAERWQRLEGFFTDEPQLSRNGIPWSFVLPGEYEKAHGEKLVDLLPQLFVAVGDYQKTRYRFWRLVTTLFSRNFFEKIYDWCQRHELKLTGHLVNEETLLEQLTSNGAVMPHYHHFHLPGIDSLGRGLSPVTTTRQVTSVAAQMGRKEVLSESFALCGWGVRFEELKRIFQWQMVQGVTLLCPHLQSYSLRGLRKRDYPPSLFYQQPWWPDWHVLVEYVSRIGRLLVSSEPATKVAVIHPQSSAWVNFNDRDHRRIEEIDSFFLELSEALDAARIEYHYADEILLERYGSLSGSELNLGRQAYTCVVVPLVDNLSSATVRLLVDFAGAGGRLLMFDSGPLLVSGRREAAGRRLRERAVVCPDIPSLLERLAAHTDPIGVSPAGDPDIGSSQPRLSSIGATRRVIGDFEGRRALLYYLVNNDGRRAQEILLSVEEGAVLRYLADRDAFEPVQTSRARGAARVRFAFPPGGDLVLLVFPGGLPESLKGMRERGGRYLPSGQEKTVPVASLDGSFELEHSTENILLLDRCSYTIDGAGTVVDESVSVVHDRLLSLKRSVDLRLTFSFIIEEAARLAGSLYLVMENPEAFEIQVNGRGVGAAEGWFFDSGFIRFPIGEHVKTGTNAIALHTTYRQSPAVYRAVEQAKKFEAEKNKLTFESEIEAVYLAGDFSVRTPGTFTPLDGNAVRYRGQFTLAALSKRIDIEAPQASGFPFFAGILAACKQVDLSLHADRQYYLECDEIGANSIGVEVNGAEAGKLYWRPYRLRITEHLVEGENVITLRLTTSLRNMLGPHHLEAGDSHCVGPFSFFKEDGVFARNWDGTLNEWTDDYCFLQFGVKGLRISRGMEAG